MSIIAVIDDRVTNRKVLARLAASLEDSPTVKSFSDPRDALAWAKSNVPDLVITGFKMPAMDGAAFIRKFREYPHCTDIPVMVVTAYEDRTFRYSALEAGATDFLLTPVDHQEFRARSKNLLTLRAHQKLINERAVHLERRIERESDQHERALRESHKRLLRVVDAVPAMIGATTSNGRYVFINSYQASCFGVGPDEASGKTAVELLGNDYARNVLELDLKVFETGDAPPSFEETFYTNTGARRIFLTTKSPVRNDLGRITHVVTVSLDITDRKAAEAALVDAKEAAELANRSKSDFLANMSHELRTPLNAVVGFSQVIASEMFGPVGNPRYLDYSRSIEESGSLLCHIIEDILDVSMIEAGKVPLREESVRVVGLLDDVVRLASERAEQAGVEIETRITAGGACLWADSSKVKQILLNLLTNAIKYSPRDGKIVTSARTVRGALQIRVEDHGVGMDADEVRVAMTRFGRVERSSETSHPGTGLGLPLAIDLTELHGGTLRVDSRKGKGTTVVVTFPAERLLPTEAKKKKASG